MVKREGVVFRPAGRLGTCILILCTIDWLLKPKHIPILSYLCSCYLIFLRSKLISIYPYLSTTHDRASFVTLCIFLAKILIGTCLGPFWLSVFEVHNKSRDLSTSPSPLHFPTITHNYNGFHSPNQLIETPIVASEPFSTYITTLNRLPNINSFTMVGQLNAVNGVQAILGYTFVNANTLWLALQAAGSGVGGNDGNKVQAMLGDTVLKLILIDNLSTAGRSRGTPPSLLPYIRMLRVY